MPKKLPKDAVAYVAVIGRSNAEAMRSVAHKGVVQGGRRGEMKQPRFQITCPDGSVLCYRAQDGRAEIERVGANYSEQDLSNVLNNALRVAAPVSRMGGI